MGSCSPALRPLLMLPSTAIAIVVNEPFRSAASYSASWGARNIRPENFRLGLVGTAQPAAGGGVAGHWRGVYSSAQSDDGAE
jgi:hypothetical protein